MKKDQVVIRELLKLVLDGDNAPMAIIEFVDRDIEAKKVDKKKKDPSGEVNKKEEKKAVTA